MSLGVARSSYRPGPRTGPPEFETALELRLTRASSALLWEWVVRVDRKRARCNAASSRSTQSDDSVPQQLGVSLLMFATRFISRYATREDRVLRGVSNARGLAPGCAYPVWIALVPSCYCYMQTLVCV